MKITEIRAHALKVPVEIDAIAAVKRTEHAFCVVEVETDAGITGHGMSSIGPVEVIAAAVDRVAAPTIIGDDPLNTDRIWEKLYWLLAPRGQTGVALHAIAAIDCALWDIKGKHFGEPVWRLLGGARDRCPVYATFGFGFYDRDELAEAALAWRARGFERLKMTVGMQALQRRDEPRPMLDAIREDAARVKAVREALGEGPEIFIDANCSLDLYHAEELARMIEPYEISFFEEPITQNDVRSMAALKSRTSIRLACGQNEGLSLRFRDLLIAGAVDVIQPNVAITGGYTQCVKIAGMAQAFNIPIDNGGAWPYVNQHLQAGLMNGGLVEYHVPAVACSKLLYEGIKHPVDGWLEMPEAPGLGFELRREAVEEYRIRS